MVKLNEIQLDMQHEASKILTLRDNVDILVRLLLEMVPQLKPDARLAHSPYFEQNKILQFSLELRVASLQLNLHASLVCASQLSRYRKRGRERFCRVLGKDAML